MDSDIQQTKLDALLQNFEAGVNGPVNGPQKVHSLRTPWARQVIGLIGDPYLFDILRFEAPVLFLTPEDAVTFIAAKMIDVLVIAPTPKLANVWGWGMVDGNKPDTRRTDIFQTAKDNNIPVIGYVTEGAEYAQVLDGIIGLCQSVACTQPAMAAQLSRKHKNIQVTPPPIQGAIHHGIYPLLKKATPEQPVIWHGFRELLNTPDTVTFIKTLRPFGLSVYDTETTLKAFDAENLELSDNIIGHITTHRELQLFETSKILVQTQNARAADLAVAHRAAACGIIVVVLGPKKPTDPRATFAHFFDASEDCRAFISQVLLDTEFGKKLGLRTWRTVHLQNNAMEFTAALLTAAGYDVTHQKTPSVTVVTPTYRPHLLAKTIAQFRALKWPHKELVIVANTDNPDDWDQTLINADLGEKILFLPRDFGAGTALNMGMDYGTGDYITRMDDDDIYGPYHISDLMIAAQCISADFLGRTAEYYEFEEGGLQRRNDMDVRAVYFTSKELREGGKGHIAGFSHTIKRSVLTKHRYDDFNLGFADVAILRRFSEQNLRCVRLNGLGAVVTRRKDVSTHTWKNAPNYVSKQYTSVVVPIEDLLL